MSNEQSASSGSAPVASGDEGKAANQVSYDSFSKVLGEKKKLQKEHEEMKMKLDLYEQEKLEAEGKIKEANENLKKRVQESDERFKDLFKKVTLKSFKSEFHREAEKLGCVDAELAYMACDFSDIEVTEDIEFNKESISKKVESLSKAKPHLFRKDVKLPNDMTPSSQGGFQQKSLSDMSEKELKELWKTIK